MTENSLCDTLGIMLYTLPNILTLSRICAVPIIVLFMWDPGAIHYFVAVIIFTVAGITDYLDGYLARTSGTVSKLGQFLDPVADKIIVAAVIVMLIKNGIVSDMNIIAALIILLREIVVSGLREYLAGLRVSVPVSAMAKWKTAFQMISLGGLILSGGPSIPFINVYDASVSCLWIAAILTLITGYDYLRVGLKHMA